MPLLPGRPTIGNICPTREWVKPPQMSNVRLLLVARHTMDLRIIPAYGVVSSSSRKIVIIHQRWHRLCCKSNTSRKGGVRYRRPTPMAGA
jgi:hypothetical protein